MYACVQSARAYNKTNGYQTRSDRQSQVFVLLPTAFFLPHTLVAKHQLATMRPDVVGVLDGSGSVLAASVSDTSFSSSGFGNFMDASNP